MGSAKYSNVSVPQPEGILIMSTLEGSGWIPHVSLMLFARCPVDVMSHLSSPQV